MTEISLFLPNILLAFLTYVIATGSPGPATLAIMGVAMGQGRPAGLVFALGVVTGSFCWAIIAALGLTQLLASYASALTVIKTLGALYLFYLAFKAFRSAMTAKSPITQTDKPLATRKQLFIHGLLLHLTNPKAAFSWLAIVSISLKADAPQWVAYVVVLGCTCLGVMVFSFYAMVFSNPKMIALYHNARRRIEAVMVMVFGFAGFKLLTYDF